MSRQLTDPTPYYNAILVWCQNILHSDLDNTLHYNAAPRNTDVLQLKYTISGNCLNVINCSTNTARHNIMDYMLLSVELTRNITGLWLTASDGSLSLL